MTFIKKIAVAPLLLRAFPLYLAHQIVGKRPKIGQ
jgi:hypothetical protein